ncbi:TetR/AcrR family transcriptional regulator [Telmatobacter bradus]|uniref:TetR/AcrR family transcriptional regulator n=1 Tax=Telmatobacter bradus TaxID=474953 RepID=UPI003B42DCF4
MDEVFIVKLPNPIDICCSKRPVGRPRSEGTRAAILASAYEFLETLPVAEITTVHIARKAGASTATVYRWWSTKEALLLDAFMDRIEALKELHDAGTPLERLRSHVLEIGRFFSGKSGIVVARLLTAIQDNAVLREEFLGRVIQPETQDKHDLVAEAVLSGELPASTDISFFLDCIIGPLVGRLLKHQSPINDEFVLAVFDHVVAGVRAIALAKSGMLYTQATSPKLP